MSPRPESRRAATVADIARAAKVSKATAARALGDYGQVSDAVRSRVQAAAEELNYRPNALAKSMNTGRSNTIGVVVGDIENPFFAHAMRGISDVASKAGYDVILTNSDEDVEAEKAAVEVLLDKRVDALIVAPASSARVAHLANVGAAGRPLVLLDRRADGQHYDSVTVDNRTRPRTRRPSSSPRAIAASRSSRPTTTPRPSTRRATPITMSSVADRVAGVMEALDRRGRPVTRELHPSRCAAIGAWMWWPANSSTGDEPVTADHRVRQPDRDDRVPDDPHAGPAHPGGRLAHRLRQPGVDEHHHAAADGRGAADLRAGRGGRARWRLQRIRGERVDDEAVVFDARLVRRASVGPAPPPRASPRLAPSRFAPNRDSCTNERDLRKSRAPSDLSDRDYVDAIRDWRVADEDVSGASRAPTARRAGRRAPARSRGRRDRRARGSPRAASR